MDLCQVSVKMIIIHDLGANFWCWSRLCAYWIVEAILKVDVFVALVSVAS
jgi:hypothetical protein